MLRVSLVTAVAVLASAAQGTAGIVTFQFTGTVAAVSDGPNFALNGAVPTGTTVTGSFGYNTATAGTSMGPTTSFYSGAPLAFSVNIGGGLFQWNETSFNFFNPGVLINTNFAFLNADSFDFLTGENPATNLTLPPGATTSSSFALRTDVELIDFSGTAFSDTSLPATLDLAKFQFAGLQLEGGEPSSTGSLLGIGFIQISLDSLTLQPAAVPEPASLTLLGLGVTGIAGYAWRRRR
jgi:hypothetical protein